MAYTDVLLYGIASASVNGSAIDLIEKDSTITVDPIYQTSGLGGNVPVAWKARATLYLPESNFWAMQPKLEDWCNNLSTMAAVFTLKSFNDAGAETTRYIDMGLTGLGQVDREATLIGLTVEGMGIETVDSRMRGRLVLQGTYTKRLTEPTMWAAFFY